MINTFPIDFVRQLLEQTLLEEHIKNPHMFGGPNQVNLFSFYEQLQRDDEVNRYVEIYRDLVDQQNRTGLIMNGTIVAPENPTITNINNATIIPMTFTCMFRVKLKDRDSALKTISNLIQVLKGRKHDIAEFDNGQLFKVGTIANNVNGNPYIKNGDFIGEFVRVSQPININSKIEERLTQLNTNYGITFENNTYPKYLYFCYRLQANPKGYLKVAKKSAIDGTWEQVENTFTDDFIYPPQNEYFNKYQLSVSFDSIRCDEPRTLNAEDYCEISFGGSATLCDYNILMGNEITKVGIARYKIVAKTPISITENLHWLEPLELPSGNSADTQINQLISNKFVNNTHTDSLTLSLQYSFVLDKNNSLLSQWYKYARYGQQADGISVSYLDGISPNMIYKIVEMSCCWGVVDYNTIYAKIIESIDIENTESDVMSITIPFQIQGENN